MMGLDQAMRYLSNSRGTVRLVPPPVGPLAGVAAVGHLPAHALPGAGAGTHAAGDTHNLVILRRNNKNFCICNNLDIVIGKRQEKGVH